MSTQTALPTAPPVEPEAAEPPPKRRGGPTTPEGKRRSRRNSLKRGLRSKVVFPEDLAETVEKRILYFANEFAPKTPYEAMLVRDMATSSVRFERCAALAIADLVRLSDRAAFCWEEDRRKSVEDFAMWLSKEPERIARGLRQSRQGTDWLIERWTRLAAIAREVGAWNEDQRRLAFDMLGVPRDLRNLTIDVPAGDEATALIALAEAQIARLREDQVAVLDELNEAERAQAFAGMPLEEDAVTARLRKDESRARNDFAKARNALFRRRETARAGDKVKSLPVHLQPTCDRPRLAGAALDNFIRRIDLQYERVAEDQPAKPAGKEAVVVEEPVLDEEKPVVNAPVSPAPAKRPLNRRARREIARRAREQAKREARAARTH
jgi:hypothetical protein